MSSDKEIYIFYHDQIRAFIYKIIENWHDSEDITQDVFLSYLTCGKVIEGYNNYLYRCARNACMNYLRRKESHKRYTNVSIMEGELYEESHKDKEIALYNEARVKKVEKAIERMRDGQYKRILQSHLLRGMSINEIARELNIARQTTVTHKIRGMNRLKDNIFGCKK